MKFRANNNWDFNFGDTGADTQKLEVLILVLLQVLI
jgi:hypothetical protein